MSIDADSLRSPESSVGELRQAANRCESLVIELGVAFDAPPAQVDQRPHHLVGVGHTFWIDELHHLVWSNAVDARQPDAPRWPLIDACCAIGATLPAADAPGDVVLPTGEPAWLDAGPIAHRDPIAGIAVVHALQVAHNRLVVPLPNVSAADLAPDQNSAVTHGTGSARIIAPAGSGKTRVLTERARHLIDVWRMPAGAISLVAFNKRAQLEMRARTTDLAGLDVRTLNSIALAIVNGVAPFGRQSRQWRTIDEPEVRAILQRFVQTPRKLNVDPLAPWIDALSAIRLGLADPAMVEARYGGDVTGLEQVWPLYRDALESAGAVDFDDQIRRAIHVLLSQPEARRAAQRVCRVLLVDEFQDLTPAHMLLVRLLSGAGGAVFGVGDDDQTIYGYNGADPGWLIEFATYFPGAGDHPLEVNYRCPADVVEVADRLLRHNRRRVAKVIRSGRDRESNQLGWVVDDRPDVVGATVEAVQRALHDGASPGDIAVLTRVNATLVPVQLALAVAGVPIQGGLGVEFLDRVAVRAGLAWLRLASGARFSSADLGEALRRPTRGLSPRVRDWVGEQTDIAGLHRLADRLTTPKDAQRVTEFAADIERLRARLAASTTVAQLLTMVIDEVGVRGAVDTLDADRRGMNRAAQGDDLLALVQAAALHPDPAGFESWLRGLLVARRDPDGVVLSTVHRVKGQEWPFVVAHLAQVEQYPHRLSDDREEERRIFHVAITRASQRVTITTGGEPSSFVSELTTDPPAVLRSDSYSRPSTPGRAAVPPRVTSKATAKDEPSHPLLERQGVMAVAGLVLVDQGVEWTISDLEPAAAVAVNGAAIRRFGLGERVETTGRQRGPLRPRSGDVSDESVRLFDLLRVFRERVRDGKPAYTVFDDKTLAAIASALPTDLGELARVRGVGPAKLELYGDEVLDLATEALAAPSIL